MSTAAPAFGSLYSGTKGAVDSITKSLAKELGQRKIRVNAVNPGYVQTEGTAGFAGSDFEKQAIASNPYGRAGTPSDITPAIVFLASDESVWITGETLYVSAGAGT